MCAQAVPGWVGRSGSLCARAFLLTAAKVSVCSVRREQVSAGFIEGSDITVRNNETMMIANAGDVTRPYQYEPRIK